AFQRASFSTVLEVRQCRPLLVPLRRLLVGLCRLQQNDSPPGSGGQLQADRQAVSGESGGNGNRGNPPDVERARVPEHEQFLRTQILWMFAQVGDPWRRNRNGGRQQHVHFIEYFVDGLTARLEVATGTQSVGCGDVGSGLDARQRGGLVKFGRSICKTFVISIGLGAREHPIGGDFKFDVANLGVKLAKNIDRFFDRVRSLGMKVVEKKSPWHTDAQIRWKLIERRNETWRRLVSAGIR